MLSRKEQCKEIMAKLFGPYTAAQVDKMNEYDCVELCRTKAKGFLGEDAAKPFDNIR